MIFFIGVFKVGVEVDVLVLMNTLLTTLAVYDVIFVEYIACCQKPSYINSQSYCLQGRSKIDGLHLLLNRMGTSVQGEGAGRKESSS